MPAPLLKRFAVSSAANTAIALVPTVGPNRSLVIAKLSLHIRGGQTVVAGGFHAHVWLGPTTGDADIYIQAYPMAPGDQYSEGGLVVPAGSSVNIAMSAGGPSGAFVTGLFCQAFGEEVDN